MDNEGENSHSNGIIFEQAHEIIRDIAIIKLQEQVRKLTIEL